MPIDLGAIRTDYAHAGLDESDLAPHPLEQLQRWVADAIAAGHPEPNAMTLGTATPDGVPDTRVVLLKGVDDVGLVFYTNYESAKGRQIVSNPRASANLFWVLLERQIRVRGRVEKTSRTESEAYFASRPRESQLGAWASQQSTRIESRRALLTQHAEAELRFHKQPIECPPHWGGFRIVPDQVEFWQGRPGRLHDRLRYTHNTDGLWCIERLQP